MIFVCHVTLQGPHDQSVIRLFGLEHLKISDQHCKFSCHRHYDSRVMIFFFLSRDLKRQRDQKVMRFYGLKPLVVSHHPDGHRHCGSRDMMFLVVEQQYSICPCLDPSLLFISRVQGMLCCHTQNFRM